MCRFQNQILLTIKYMILYWIKNYPKLNSLDKNDVYNFVNL